MSTNKLPAEGFVELISYDAFLTAIGLSVGAGGLRLIAPDSSHYLALTVSTGALSILALFLYRLSSSIEKRSNT